MLTPKVVGFLLLVCGILAILYHLVFHNKLVLFYGWMLILFGLAAFVRILANPAILKHKTFLLVGLDTPSAVGLAELLCKVGAKVLLLREDFSRSSCQDLHRKFPKNVQELPGEDIASEMDSTLQERTLKGVVFLSEKFLTADVELMPSARVVEMFNENVLKVTRIVKVLLPFLRESRGRAVFLGSTAGRLALPTTGHFSLTKFALEGFSDSLRRELRRFDAKVITVERCLHLPLVLNESLHEAMSKEANDEVHETFGAQYLEEVSRGVRTEVTANDVFIRTFTEALAAENPKDRYLLCPEGKKFCACKMEAVLSQFVPATVMDIWVESRYAWLLPPCRRLPPPHIK